MRTTSPIPRVEELGWQALLDGNFDRLPAPNRAAERIAEYGRASARFVTGFVRACLNSNACRRDRESIRPLPKARNVKIASPGDHASAPGTRYGFTVLSAPDQVDFTHVEAAGAARQVTARKTPTAPRR